MVSARDLKVWWDSHIPPIPRVMCQGHEPRGAQDVPYGERGGHRNFPKGKFGRLKLERQRRWFWGGGGRGIATKAGGVFSSLCSSAVSWEKLIFCSASFLGIWNLNHPWGIFWDTALVCVKEWCYLQDEIKQHHVGSWQNQASFGPRALGGWSRGTRFWGGRMQED